MSASAYFDDYDELIRELSDASNLAQQIVSFLRKHGGCQSDEDFANYAAEGYSTEELANKIAEFDSPSRWISEEDLHEFYNGGGLTVIIDHETYGDRSEFESLEDAELTLQDIGEDYLGTVLTVRGSTIYDETGQKVGCIE